MTKTSTPSRTPGPARVARAAFAGLVAASFLAACSVPRTPYTGEQALNAEVGIPLARSWADRPDPAFERHAREAIAMAETAGRRPTYLTLSGGGGDGAYGAGILNGWTESGKRPEFTIVSGVSTGALMAPFAFLGPRYDGVLREIYTSGIAETLLADLDIVSAVTGSSIFSSDRLKDLTRRYVTPEIVAEIARESARGRLLYVLTTNLDAQRPVLWDMSAIAVAGTPASIELFRDVLVASASIPAVFPPVLVDATAGGAAFQEMHVDGSVSANVFTLPRSYLSSGRNRASTRGGVIYVLLNTSPKAAFEVVDNRTVSIVGRTVSLGFKEQTRTDLEATYAAAKRDGFDFNVTGLAPKEQSRNAVGFDTPTMRRLYDLGFQRARSGRFWEKNLDSFAPEERRPEVAAR